MRGLLLISLFALATLGACSKSNGSADAGQSDQQTSTDGTTVTDSSAVDLQSPADATPNDGQGNDTTLSDLADQQAEVTPPADASAETLDQSVGDTTEPPNNNVIPNPGFEDWSEDIPDYWLGSESSLQEEDFAEFTGSVHGGFRAILLANPTDSHKRFTIALTLKMGKYHCTYWVKGKGEIRTGKYDGAHFNYDSYHAIDGDWTEKSYTFSVLEETNTDFQLIFSVQNTELTGGHLVLDDVYCYRDPHPCDTLTCGDWQTCEYSGQCKAKSGFCDGQSDCWSYQQCNTGTHACELKLGQCADTADCDVNGATPKCELPSHTCVAGDPCEGVVCDSWKGCENADGKCHLLTDRCDTSDDCTGDKPACDLATHTCVSAEHASNLLLNGGFESWSLYEVPYKGEHLLPDSWYGEDIPGSSEIDPKNVLPYTSSVQSGSTAVQLINEGKNQRFTTEIFTLPSGKYTCSYYIRGHGSFRHRWYSRAGWGKWVDHFQVDSLEWTRVSWKMNGQFPDLRLIFYPSYTKADKDHIQIDSVLCTKE